MAGVTAAVIGGGAAIYSAKKQAKAADKSIDAQQDALASAEAQNERNYARAEDVLTPYILQAEQYNRQLAEAINTGYGFDRWTERNPIYGMLRDDAAEAAQTIFGVSGQKGTVAEELAQANAGITNQAYNDYINTLKQLADPSAAMALAGYATGQSTPYVQSATNIGAYEQNKADAYSSAVADIAKAAGSVFKPDIGGNPMIDPTTGNPFINQNIAQTTGTITPLYR